MNQRERARQRSRSESEPFAALALSKRLSIELRIDKLVLSGLEVTAREQISDALQNELMGLLSERGLPRRALAVNERETIDGGAISIPGRAQAAQLGREIARAIYSGLSSGVGVDDRERRKF